MTIDLNPDSAPENTGKTKSFYFGSSEEAMIAGVRVRPADLARLFGVTKQAVSGWVKDGRITLGADGRADPRAAVNQLIATGNPAKLRATFLKPLVTELGAARRCISELEQALAGAIEDASFHESSATEMTRLLDALRDAIESEWFELIETPKEQGLAALLAWIDEALEVGPSPDRRILDMTARSDVGEEGADFATPVIIETTN